MTELKDLKVGDKAIRRWDHPGGNRNMVVVTVEKVTKTGRIVVDGETYLPGGSVWGRRSNYSLIPYSKEAIIEWEANQERRLVLERVNWLSLSDDQARRIYDILHEEVK